MELFLPAYTYELTTYSILSGSYTQKNKKKRKGREEERDHQK